MTEWSQLSHAYGPATDVPDLLRSVTPEQKDPLWGEIWSRLCHQGTVYSASFAALELLGNIIAVWPTAGRIMPLSLAGTIVSAREVVGDRESLRKDAHGAICRLEQLSTDTLIHSEELDDAAFIYLLEACAALKGDTLWGRSLQYLVDGEFTGTCTSCDGEIYLVIGSYGIFVTGEEWVRRTSIVQGEIKPADFTHLEGMERWLSEQASGFGRTQVSEWLLHTFGSFQCPHCKVDLSVPATIATGI